jgi:hypothetical protein
MANAFNSMSRGVIFQELHVEGGDIIQLIPFVHAFYTLKSPLFYSHNNRDGDVIIIPFAMGIHQGDPLKGALFTLTHFRALHFIANHFLLIYFDPLQMTFTSLHPPPPPIVSSTYVAWSPFGLLFDFNTPSQFNH